MNIDSERMREIYTEIDALRAAVRKRDEYIAKLEQLIDSVGELCDDRGFCRMIDAKMEDARKDKP